ncbi:hypothetical protein SAMN05660976_05700 [Nonomuraea pusilla]|uniref:Uncharacterized protein n=1 Tax=Nonomuraea pusilla TaxID=46177 RepID=A0A1H8A2M9_9ACTN|nr:hypothetical protein SAMN05660976_05700 [Nonomuraea pusilla]
MQPAHDISPATPIDPGVETARSFYLLEESWPVIGEIGSVRPFATTDELRARLEPKLHRDSSGRLHHELLLGQSVNVWTVQQGRLAAGLDVTECVRVWLPSGVTTTVFKLNRHQWDFSSGKRADPPPPDEGARLSLDWDGILARLPALETPLASPGDENLTVCLDGPHPAPDILSDIDILLDALAEEPRPEWADGLEYGSPFTL